MPVFFCYAHEDKDFVDRLARQLVERRAWVWIDRWELSVGDSLVDRVQQAIQEATAVVVILSRASVASRWVQRELSSIIYREVETKQALVIPVIVEDCQVPPFLNDRLYADFRQNFDDGMRTVLEAVARVTSATQGRIDAPLFHTDWGVDWGDRGEYAFIRLTLLHHAELLPYSILTQLEIIGNDVATRRYEAFKSRGLEWIQHGLLIDQAANWAQSAQIRFVLEDAMSRETKMRATDPARGIWYDFILTCRWIGTDTGKDVLINIGDSLVQFNDEWRRRVRPPTESEMQEFFRLMTELR